MKMHKAHASRAGTILIVVAGMAAILLALCLTFLIRMRSDAEESAAFLQEAQAKCMMSAALSYVQETARMGWDDPSTPNINEEAYGWVDVRDGSPGPKDHIHRPLAAFDAVTGLGADFPAIGGRAARCPMFVMKVPPTATEMTVSYNPLPRLPTGNWTNDISYANAEPRPAMSGVAFADWCKGDTRPRPESLGLGWFRIYRMTQADCDAHRDALGVIAPIAWSPAVFTITCAAGQSQGYRDWAEVVAAGASAEFGDDPAAFAEMRSAERILWYVCEWHPSVASDGIFHSFESQWTRPVGEPVLAGTNMNQTYPTNFGGRFQYIERLAIPPDRW